jgi:hypothetical protein
VLKAIEAGNVATLQLFALRYQLVQRSIYNVMKAVRILIECISNGLLIALCCYRTYLNLLSSEENDIDRGMDRAA